MNSLKIKTLLIIFSIIFVVRVITLFAADIRFDSYNAELYFDKYSVLSTLPACRTGRYSGQSGRRATSDERRKQLQLLERAIDLCPSQAKYHLYYALTLSRMVKRPNVQTRACVLSELKKACELKPFSGLYRGIYEKYAEKYGDTAGRGKR